MHDDTFLEIFREVVMQYAIHMQRVPITFGKITKMSIIYNYILSQLFMIEKILIKVSKRISVNLIKN